MPKRRRSGPLAQSARRDDTVLAQGPASGAGDGHASLKPDFGLPWIITAVILMLYVIIAFQPISGDDLWWQLSRGRQMFRTLTLWPSTELLAHESRGEANGLGAAAIAGVYLMLGAGGLMGLRLIVLGAAGWVVIRRLRHWTSTGSVVSAAWGCWISMLAAWALAAFFDPLPMLFDMLALSVLVTLQNAQLRLADQPAPGRAVSPSLKFSSALIAALFLFWANFGHYAVVGLLLMLIAASAATLRAVFRSSAAIDATTHWLWLASGFVAGCLNPIGLRMWWESFAQAAAWTVAPAWALIETDWIPLTLLGRTTASVVFVLISLAWLVRQTMRQRQSSADPQSMTRAAEAGAATRLAQFALIHLLVWSSAAMLPLGILWLWSDWLSTGPRPTLAGGQFNGTKRAGESRAISAAILVITFMIAASGLFRSAGWGIDASLDPRYLQLALMNVRDSGTIFADDIRSAGMAAWVTGPRRRGAAAEAVPANATAGDSGNIVDHSLWLQDEPRRALLGGRLANQRRLLNDLREGRQMRYWRADATPGGWWLALNERATSLLVFSHRDTGLIRRLEPSIWKPLSLESPVLPYARAGDPAYSHRIIEILGQRQTIDQRPWAYEPPVSSGSPFDRDGWGLLPARTDPSLALHQADVFAAMELRIAALRVLSVAIGRWPGDVRLQRLWQQCQSELADQERLLVGRPSVMRSFAAGETVPAASPDQGIHPDDLVELQRVTATYRLQGPVAASREIKRFSSLTAEMRYAIVCWAIESARYDEALQQMAVLAADEAVSPELDLLLRHQRDQLWWLSEPSPTAN